jgi:hypothetical protein
MPNEVLEQRKSLTSLKGILQYRLQKLLPFSFWVRGGAFDREKMIEIRVEFCFLFWVERRSRWVFLIKMYNGSLDGLFNWLFSCSLSFLFFIILAIDLILNCVWVVDQEAIIPPYVFSTCPNVKLKRENNK